jgi:23S rRNA (adenine2503-C2)-methyltransferase
MHTARKLSLAIRVTGSRATGRLSNGPFERSAQGSTYARSARTRVAPCYGERMSRLDGYSETTIDGLERIALQGVTPEELVEGLPGVLLSDARRIVASVHSGRDFTAPNSNVRRTARELVCARGHVPTLTLIRSERSLVDPFQKLVLGTADERWIETVRIPLERPGRFSVCVSSQVGCGLGCAFCATGRMGLTRNLETWEIVEQVRQVRATLDRQGGERVHGVVFQGMGEPLSNLERVFGAVRVLTDPNALAIDARRITVSTVGLPAGILRLARELPKVRLAWSIGSALPGARVRLMPIDKAHPLEDTYTAGVEHARVTGLAPLWAVTLLAGVNDSEDDARALAALARRFASDVGRAPRISIIPYNSIAEAALDPYRRSGDHAAGRFRDVMHAAGAFTHLRYSGGSDVAAACGQLAAQRPSLERRTPAGVPTRAP